MTCGAQRSDFYVDVADMGRGFKLYVFDRLDGWPTVRGGPYATREEADAAVTEKNAELDDEYEPYEVSGRKYGSS